jgi:N-terminal domain on NACHT_NTPase and P-loop NTPases
MDPVSALGLACNVMQIISFCHETISLCKRVHREGSSDPNLDHVTSHLSRLSDNLRDSIDAAKQGKPLNRQEKDLQSIANECYKASAAVQLELAKVANVSVGSHRSAIQATLKTVWRRSNLEKLEKTMTTNQRLLESKLLEQI